MPYKRVKKYHSFNSIDVEIAFDEFKILSNFSRIVNFLNLKNVFKKKVFDMILKTYSGC